MRVGSTWQKAHSNRQISDRVGDAALRELTRKKSARDLCQNTRAITALPVGSHATTVSHVTNRLHSEGQDLMAWLTILARNKADPARIMLEARIIQAAQ
jgi:hypothetical protein